MYAGSLVGSVRTIEAETERLLEKPTLVDDADTEASGAAVRRAIEDAAELLVVSVPIPAIGREVQQSDDEPLVEAVLEATYDHGVASAETVDAEVLDRAKASVRTRVVSDRAVVPLAAGGPRASNWPSVFAFLREKLDGALARVGRVRQRIRADGSGGQVFRTEWRSIERRLASLAVVFEYGGTTSPEYDRVRTKTDRTRTAGRRFTELFTE